LPFASYGTAFATRWIGSRPRRPIELEHRRAISWRFGPAWKSTDVMK
jgi:hypothetical protein